MITMITTVILMVPVLLAIMVLGTSGRATLPLADPTLEQPSEWQLVRGRFEFGGTSAPCGSYRRACATCYHTGTVCGSCCNRDSSLYKFFTSPKIQYDVSISGDRFKILSSQFLNLNILESRGPITGVIWLYNSVVQCGSVFLDGKVIFWVQKPDCRNDSVIFSLAQLPFSVAKGDRECEACCSGGTLPGLTALLTLNRNRVHEIGPRGENTLELGFFDSMTAMMKATRPRAKFGPCRTCVTFHHQSLLVTWLAGSGELVSSKASDIWSMQWFHTFNTIQYHWIPLTQGFVHVWWLRNEPVRESLSEHDRNSTRMYKARIPCNRPSKIVEFPTQAMEV